jgi:RNA polymerase sigma-70 factor (ECF subfamily)
MSDAADFAAIMDRLRQGDQTIAWEIFQRFAQRLVGLARMRLDSRLRAKVDPEDVMQSAFKSFFCRHAQGQFDVDSWDSLWALLTVITLRKCGLKTGHFLAARRDVRRESQPQPGDEDSTASWQAIAREPTPEQAAQLTETVEHLFAGLDELDRQTLQLSLQGYTVAEISTRLGRTERGIYRFLKRLKAKLDSLGDDQAAEGA